MAISPATLGSTTHAARGTALPDTVGDLVSGAALILGAGTFDVGTTDFGALSQSDTNVQ
jgi:hypothetical protein